MNNNRRCIDFKTVGICTRDVLAPIHFGWTRQMRNDANCRVRSGNSLEASCFRLEKSDKIDRRMAVLNSRNVKDEISSNVFVNVYIIGRGRRAQLGVRIIVPCPSSRDDIFLPAYRVAIISEFYFLPIFPSPLPLPPVSSRRGPRNYCFRYAALLLNSGRH